MKGLQKQIEELYHEYWKWAVKKGIMRPSEAAMSMTQIKNIARSQIRRGRRTGLTDERILELTKEVLCRK